MELRLNRWTLLLAACAAAACSPPPKGDKGLPFEELTINNIVKWPDGRDYITVVGRGYPKEGEKAQEARRKSSRDGAVIAAEQKLIDALKPLAPKDKIRDLLHSAQVAKIDFAYDDMCTVTMRLDKQLLDDQPKQTDWNNP